MMETKLFAALCALLLVHSGSADDSENQTASALTSNSTASAEAGPVTTAAYSEPRATVDGTSSWRNNITTHQEIIAVTSTPEKNGTSPTQPPLQDPHSTSAIHPSASHTSDSTSTISSTHTAHTLSADLTATSPPNYNTSHTAAPVLPATSSTQLNQPEITSSAIVPTSPPSKPEHTSAAFIPHATSSSSISSHQPHSSPSSAHTTSSDSHHQTTTSMAQLKSSTAKSPSGPSAQAKTHTDNSSELSMENDPTMVRDSSTLDPLLAGLVSAFIITAVVITLLLFLKLRRRDNRPEFRRLQDLPMDDMMEDTPLSMYSY